MNTNKNDNFHGASGAPAMEGKGPSLAERARTLMQAGGHSSLATLSKKHAGYPFTSLMPYALDEQGRPLFLISQMAMHTKNIKDEPRTTLLVTEDSTAVTPLGAARISLMGLTNEVPEDEVSLVADHYLARHPEARQWAGYGDFGYFRMEPMDSYFVGGFGVMGWITAEDYRAADPDPLASIATEVISHMNEDHGEALDLLARTALAVSADNVRMTSLDRYGFHVLLVTPEGRRGARIDFPRTANSADEVRQIFIDLVRDARRGTS